MAEKPSVMFGFNLHVTTEEMCKAQCMFSGVKYWLLYTQQRSLTFGVQILFGVTWISKTEHKWNTFFGKQKYSYKPEKKLEEFLIYRMCKAEIQNPSVCVLLTLSICTRLTPSGQSYISILM